MKVEFSQGPFRVLTASVSNYPFSGQYAITFLFAPTKQLFETKGFLEEGTLDQNGERPCLNLQLKGTLLGVPENANLISSRKSLVANYDHPGLEMRRILKYKTTKNQVVEKTGPVFTNHIPTGYFETFTDCYQDKIWGYSARNQKIELVKLSEYSFTLTVSREVRFNYSVNGVPARTWQNQSETSYYKFNSTFTRVSQGSGWYDLQVIAASKPSELTPVFTIIGIPRNPQDTRMFIERLRKCFIPINADNIYGDLVRRCANDTRTVPTNSIELIAEIASMANTVKGIASLATGNVDPKLLGKTYLTYKYGPRLTALSLKTIAEGFEKRLRNLDRNTKRSRAMDTLSLSSNWCPIGDLKVIYNYKIIYKEYQQGLTKFIRQWFDSGLFPSLTNAWDLIPLSFVIDWFLNVEKALDSIDANTYWCLHEIMGTVFTCKETFYDVAGMFYSPG